MLIRLLVLLVAAVLLSCTAALASEFDGMTVRQIRGHKDFVRDTTSMSSAFNTASKGGRRVYHWIGYIPVGETRVYFTSFGEPLTCVLWDASGEWVPQWAGEALDRLETEGYIKLNPTASTAEAAARIDGLAPVADETEAEVTIEAEASAEAEVTAEAVASTGEVVAAEAEVTVEEELTTSAEVTVSESAGS